MVDLSALNSQQRAVIDYDSGHFMFVAGAGAGKSRSLVYKTAHLVDQGIPESTIYLSTFTNQAAKEFSERLSDMLGEYSALRLNMGTFHSICNTLNKKLMTKAVGNVRRKQLVKGWQVWNFHRRMIKNNDLIAKDVKEIIQRISLWKNEGLLPEDLEKKYPDMVGANPKTLRLASLIFSYKEYQKFLRLHNCKDFDDMLLDFYFNLINPKYEKAAKKTCSLINYMFLDEGQDSNALQYNILRAILKHNPNCKVGLFMDDFQAIYAFRGGSIPELFKFRDDLGLKTLVSEQNYRSTPQIIKACNSLIKHNKNQVKKSPFTKNADGLDNILRVHNSSDEEAEWITEKVSGLVAEGFAMNEIAILMRINSQARAITDQFVLNDIPHYVHGDYSFYKRTEIKDIVSYCKILYNPKDADVSDFRAIINKPTRYLSTKTVSRIDDFYEIEGYETFWDALFEHYRVDGLKQFEQDNLTAFVTKINSLHEHIAENNTKTEDIIRMVVDNVGYGRYIKEQYEESTEDPDDDKGLNIDALYDGAYRFENPADWFAYIESVQNKKNENTDDCIQVMSVHRSKGQEYDAVFIVGVCDRIFPFYKAKTQEDIEEERRICYVAASRPKERLFLSALTGKFGRFNVRPSPFINEMRGIANEEEKPKTVLRKAAALSNS